MVTIVLMKFGSQSHLQKKLFPERKLFNAPRISSPMTTMTGDQEEEEEEHFHFQTGSCRLSRRRVSRKRVSTALEGIDRSRERD